MGMDYTLNDVSLPLSLPSIAVHIIYLQFQALIY